MYMSVWMKFVMPCQSSRCFEYAHSFASQQRLPQPASVGRARPSTPLKSTRSRASGIPGEYCRVVNIRSTVLQQYRQQALYKGQAQEDTKTGEEAAGGGHGRDVHPAYTV